MTVCGTPQGPIGVFDSGLGGLTVAAQILDLMPQESIVYVADQAHVPYGSRNLNEVRGFAIGISAALAEYGCKAIVMACNISSATALEEVASDLEIPVMGVILPGAREAAARTRNGKIGVLATVGTVKTAAYTRAIQQCDPSIDVYENACPEFVPLVESGQMESPAAHEACRNYLEFLLAMEVDTVVLGCTHYPFLLPALQSVAPRLRFVDPAEQTARELAATLTTADLRAPRDAKAQHLLTTSGDVTAFRGQLSRFWESEDSVAGASWANGILHIPAPATQELVR
jgi:glutamate racemase